ncbi:MAG: class I SAM-dependent methyltransferase [Alphaproteobacteria bacterium]
MGALDTLFYVIKQSSFPIKGAKIVFLNAYPHAQFDLLQEARDVLCQQVWKVPCDELTKNGFAVSQDLTDDFRDADIVCLNVPANAVEARYLMAAGLTYLKKGGVFLCAADNKAGGTRLKKMLEGFGLSDITSESRNKARCCWAENHNLDQPRVDVAIKAGGDQTILDGRFESYVGIYGWNKIDKGSEILTRYIPGDLKGKGADFGCGYGYLSDHLLSHCPKVKKLSMIDADIRALRTCEQNIERYDTPKEFIWADLTQVQRHVQNLQFIVMNPPFHQGKKEDIGIGRQFIETAYQALGRNGRLWMVANNHLPYEELLSSRFFDCKKHHEGQGFKVYEAIK